MIKKPRYRICRRLGPGVYDKCQTTKFSTTSGKFGASSKRPKALTEYGTQLLEKQKIKFSYGITERQLSNYVEKATQIKGAGTVTKFYELLESRVDNVIYRLGIAPTRRAARQMVSHGHIVVNKNKITVPSFELKTGDAIKVREGSKTKKIFDSLTEKLKDYTTPSWLSFDTTKMEGKMISKPKNTDTFLDLNAVLEFYSR